MKMRTLLAGIAFLAAGSLSAATLNVKLTVSHGIESPEGPGARSRKVAYFVVDRSGSMNFDSLEGGKRKPNDALLESMQMRLDALPDGSVVYVVPFASYVKTIRSFPALDKKTRRQIVDYIKQDKPNGCTLLYDAQEIALTEAGRTMQRDPGAEVSVYVYTDGLHETPSDYQGDYPACFHKKVGRRWVENPDYRREKDAAYAKFKKKFADLVAKPTLELEYEWLSDSAKPDPEKWGTRPSLAAELKSRVSELKNPCAEPEQTVECQLFLPISDSCWKEVASKETLFHLEVDGRRSSTQVLVKDGTYRIDWPSLPSDHPAVARLSFSHMPKGKKFELKVAKPLVLNVPAQGQTPFSVVSPPAGAVYPVDANVVFSAKASEGVDVEWSIAGGKGGVIRGLSANWKATAPGRIDYCATAHKQRCRDASANGSFEVIPTGVEIVSVTDRHEVGKESEFRAKAVGQCQGYAWKIDGNSVPGGTGDTIKYLFKKPGRHVVGVTARYKAGIMKDAKEQEISVSKAPFLEILQPKAYGGDPEFAQYQAEKPVELLAAVDGDLTKVQWQFLLKGKAAPPVSAEVRNGHASGRFVPPKGGYYDLTVTAEGPAGKKVEKVQIFVKSTDIGVNIKQPVANDEVETGKPFELSAETKGPVKGLRWKMVDKSTAQSIAFGPSDVSEVLNGKSTIKAKLPLEIGTTSVDITAEPVVEDVDLAETAGASTITVQAKTLAEIAYTKETQEKYLRPVKYGEQEVLAVETSGAVSDVSWFMLDNGKETAIPGKGNVVRSPLVAPDGRTPKRVMEYFARGKMPGGSFVQTSPLALVHYCPPVRAVVQQPMTNNVVVASIGRKSDYIVTLKPADGEKVENVVWDMGDGAMYTNLTSVKHSYDNYGTYTIKASGRCANCGEIFKVSAPSAVVVEKQPINAEFAIRPSVNSRRTISDKVAQGRQIALVGMDSPDVATRKWTCNGTLVKDDNGNPVTNAAIEVRCVDVGDVEFGLTVFDSDGNATGPVVHTLRVYRLWVVLLAFVLALFVAGFFWWYFSGDDPRFWRVCGFVDETNSKDPSAVESEMLGFRRIFKFWDTMWNKATIPLHVLGGAQAEDWGSGTALGQTGLMLWESKTAADNGQGVRMPNCDLLNRPEGMEKESFSRGQLIHIWAPSPSNAQAVTALWVKIKMGRDVPNTYLWVRLGIALLCFGLAAAASYFFAF